MDTHPLVAQLGFARSEFTRCLEGVSPEEALQRFEPMNCLSWIVGHLANQEHSLWVMAAQGRSMTEGLNELVGFGKPATTPPLQDMWAAWHAVTAAADEYLETLTTRDLQNHLHWGERPLLENVGTLLLRNTYHYWYHLGEAHAIRQLLGHCNLPQFVGDMAEVHYRPESE